MVYDKEDDEPNWTYLERRAPELSEALDRLEEYYDAAEEVFDERTSYWDEDAQVDLTNKMCIAVLALRFEKVRKDFDELSTRVKAAMERTRGWQVLVRERHRIVFHNALGDTVAIPTALVDVLARDRSFDGTVVNAGALVRFTQAGKTVADVPKTLLVELRGQHMPTGEGG